ncbi:AAA family ATPase [Microbacterium sp. NPDC090281]|uniref:AAA family ATPase n=1 Tax=Microbacterium sp. NPDC090281 TaxID=3364208 RepID=UPI003812F533
MRLLRAHIQGVGRLVDSTIKLDQKLIAVVGPNEAGKSTLLKALEMVSGEFELPLEARSRAVEVADDDDVVTATFKLERSDLALLDDLNLAASPKTLTLSRTSVGQARLGVVPYPYTAFGAVEEHVAAFRAALPRLEELARLDTGNPDADESPEDFEHRRSLAEELHELGAALSDYFEAQKRARSVGGVDELLTTGRDLFRDLVGYSSPTALRSAWAQIEEWLATPPPEPIIRGRLYERVPSMALFSDLDRDLKSTYTLDQTLLDNTPRALTNLARLAGLDLTALVAAVETNQVSRRNTLKNQANRRLNAYFSAAWKQSSLAVELNVENKTLRIGLLEDEVFASVLEERSQGLRSFVALTAFLASRELDVPPILLIDEAENHLHINAQADLVEMLSNQDQAAKVIYTTHSPACLPSDLGVGIRAVVVDGEETSHIENNFWTQRTPAMTSLMMAMGASAAALTPARCVVVAEGASDMILLPRLIRLATGMQRLPYQIAPGLSELPPDLYPDLDFQAAKVAYLVDGDRGGEDLAKHLGRSVPASLVVSLGVPGVENLLPEASYVGAMELHRSEHSTVDVANVLELPDRFVAPWSKAANAWLEGFDVRPASKVDVASAFVEDAKLQLDDVVVEHLRTLHNELCTALGLRA